MSEIKAVDCKTFWKRSTGEIITYTEGSLMDIIQLARKDILSLITTIEAQREDQRMMLVNWNTAVKRATEAEFKVEAQKEEIERWREFGKVTVQWYKDNDWPIKAIDVQAKLDWICYTPTLCEIERQAENWQEGDK